MHIITRRRLNDFAASHPDVKPSLQYWYKVMKAGKFQSFVELRTVFPAADQVGILTVFNIGGNKARLIAAVHYNRQKIYIRAIMLHAEYDEGKWRK
jgi:mRNA interferase HigB